MLLSSLTPGRGRAALTAEPGPPVCLRFLPGSDRFRAAGTLKGVFLDNNHRDTVATCRPATDGAVTDEHIVRLLFNIKADGPTVTFAASHAFLQIVSVNFSIREVAFKSRLSALLSDPFIIPLSIFLSQYSSRALYLKSLSSV
ncbi:MAG: hypothetical protein ACI8Z1_002628 [Candidatus Azotimanducaceae bacterium]|jgi:hypothetical protein